MSDKQRFGDYLIERNVINTAQLEQALKKQKELALPLGDTLIKLKFVSESLLLESLGKFLGIDYLNLAENDYQIVDKSLARVLPLEICQKYKVLPIFQLGDDDHRELTLAMADPTSEDALKEVQAITEAEITPVLATGLAIEAGIVRLYSLRTDVRLERVAVDHGGAVALVDKLFQKAVALSASDVHIEPHATEVHVRMRIDGVLELASVYPPSLHMSVVSRIKIMASSQNSLMKIEERRLPQDGSFSTKIDGHTVDGRVSTLPAIFGEKVVVRLFDKDRASYVGRIKDLKLSPRMEIKYRRCVRQPSGINVVTGPTGSGKTTTLNAVINEINTAGINIVTVEDPVEYQAPDYVNQSSLMPQAGYTYARALRAIMRQDPDVILIGEIRDRETAEIAVQAALTGHRVFSTLHTEDAAGSVVRLIDIGIPHFLVSSTLVSALNQRLVRRICQNCKEEYVPTRIEMLDLGIDKEIADAVLDHPEHYFLSMGRGCEQCRNSGYRGRQGVFELIAVTRAIRELITGKHSADAIALAARETDGANMLFEEGLRLFLTGTTTLGELQHLPRADYKLKPLEKILSDAAVH